MRKVPLYMLLLAISPSAFAVWTATITKDPLTDSKVGIASTKPTSQTEIKVICKGNEVPQLAITWKEPNSAKNITHFRYRVDNGNVNIINVNSVIGDRTTVSTGSIMESLLTDFVKRNRVVVKGEGNKYETSPIAFDLNESAVSIRNACEWHPFYHGVFRSK